MEEITKLVICGDSNAVSNLISKKPNIVREYIRDNYGLTLLDWSIFNGQHKIAAILLENGAEIEAKDRNGNTALLIAARLGKLDIVKLLLEKKANIKASNEQKNTPLLLAITRNHTQIATILIKKGADITAKNNEGNTPLLLAVNLTHPETKILLQLVGAAHNIKADKNLKEIGVQNFNTLTKIKANYPQSNAESFDKLEPQLNNITEYQQLLEFNQKLANLFKKFIAPDNNLDNIVRPASFVERLAQQEENHKEVNSNSK